MVLAVEFPIGRSGPRWRKEIIGAHLKIGFATVFIGADKKEIFAARTDAGSGLAAKEGKSFIGDADFAVVERFIIVAEYIDLFLKTVEASVIVVATGGDGSSEIFGADDGSEYCGDLVTGR